MLPGKFDVRFFFFNLQISHRNHLLETSRTKDPKAYAMATSGLFELSVGSHRECPLIRKVRFKRRFPSSSNPPIIAPSWYIETNQNDGVDIPGRPRRSECKETSRFPGVQYVPQEEGMGIYSQSCHPISRLSLLRNDVSTQESI